ncbi:MAG TPA: serpin family protein [Anaerolineaceae bacterium]|jgi:serpin B|nr:serpin family protein [Anaerolineaceae bacterium]
MKKLLLTCLAVLFSLSACVQMTPQPDPDTNLPTKEKEVFTGNVDYDPNPQYTPEEAANLVSANNQFAFDLYQQLKSGQGNLLYSPFSLYQALTMVYGGARGDTANQMREVLHYPVTDEELHRVINALNIALSSQTGSSGEDDQGFTLQIANALWAMQNGYIEPSYLDLLSENYAAGLRTVDFAQSQEAADLINQWAQENTNDKIKEIANPDMFNANTRLALTNAVYFKGAWRFPFQEADTHKQAFTLLDGEQVEVDMMMITEEFRALKNDQVQMIELSYFNSPMVMDLIAPAAGSWEAFSQTLTAGLLEDYLEQMSMNRVNLSMPKFKIETPEMDLIDPMQNLGVIDLFGMNADLSGMTGDKSLLISTLVQKAFIDVNEAGTEAAAVTIAVAQEKGMISPDPIIMSFDSPFLFLIRDKETGAILFIGQLMQP